MMRPRIPQLLSRARPPNRFFTYIPSKRAALTRPQLPFLAQPPRRREARWITTERRRWVRSEIRTAGKYIAISWTVAALGVVIFFGVEQEYIERKYPSFSGWSWNTRRAYRSVKFDEENNERVDWARTGGIYRDLIHRLETIDGEGVKEQDEGGILVEGVGKMGLDVTAKPEPWRRGYYEVIMGAARAAEHLDGWVRDTKRNTAFPANTVIGPSNPNPRPVPPGAMSAPREEDCERAFEAPETFYMKVLSTNGFTPKQKLDAALGLAAWFDYSGTPDSAREMYKWGLDIASPGVQVFGRNGNFKDGLEYTENVLDATTAVAIHHARNENLNLALPLFLSLLRARRALPTETAASRASVVEEEGEIGPMSAVFSWLTSAFRVPAFPPPPPDGTSIPTRDAKSRCQEAGLMAYIGEILYVNNANSQKGTTAGSTRAQEDGLAWTREAVDCAEAELRGGNARGVSGFQNMTKEAHKVCKECLETGLGNWAMMVRKLADEERVVREKKENAIQANTSSDGWLGFGAKPVSVDKEVEKEMIKEKIHVPGRWESEQAVVRERIRRAGDVLGAATVDGSGLLFV